MSMTLAPARGEVAGVTITDTAQGLVGFMRAEASAAVWHRPVPAGFQTWIDTLDPDHLPAGRLILKPEAVRAAVTELCDQAETPSGLEREHLIDDITMLSRVFVELMQAPYLRLRLQPVTTNACRKFHIDALRARLVCTYRGTGTQYGTGTDDGDPSDIVTVPTGAPILLRGTHWPPQPASGLLHRSPPIEGSGETRLLLVLDPVDDPADEV